MHMDPATVKAIRKEAGLSQSELARVLRISDVRAVRRWELGDSPVTGPVSIILELIDADILPAIYYDLALEAD